MDMAIDIYEVEEGERDIYAIRVTRGGQDKWEAFWIYTSI